MFTDAVVDLVEAGVVTGARKERNRGKIVAAFLMGTERLYDFVDDNPMVEMRPVDFTNDTHVIRSFSTMIAINSAIEVDLTGQVVADSIGSRIYSGVGGQMDFIRGAALAPEGRAIIALPSTAAGGTISRIAPTIAPGAGVVTTRAPCPDRRHRVGRRRAVRPEPARAGERPDRDRPSRSPRPPPFRGRSTGQSADRSPCHLALHGRVGWPPDGPDGTLDRSPPSPTLDITRKKLVEVRKEWSHERTIEGPRSHDRGHRASRSSRAGGYTLYKTQQGARRSRRSAPRRTSSSPTTRRASWPTHGRHEEATAIMSLLTNDWGYTVDKTELNPNDPLVNTASEYMYQMATITYHTLHAATTVTFPADVVVDGKVVHRPARTTSRTPASTGPASTGRNPIQGAAREKVWTATALALVGQLGVGSVTASALQIGLGMAALLGGFGGTLLLTGLGLVWATRARPRRSRLRPCGRRHRWPKQASRRATTRRSAPPTARAPLPSPFRRLQPRNFRSSRIRPRAPVAQWIERLTSDQ